MYYVRTLENKIFKHITAVSKNVYFSAFHDVVDKYNNAVHRTIKMKLIDVTSDFYTEHNGDSNESCQKMKIQKNFCERIHSKLVRRSFCC